MSYYRLYFLNPRNGQIYRFAEYEAVDDAAALALTAEHEGSEPMELWCQHRKVRFFEATPAVSAPEARAG